MIKVTPGAAKDKELYAGTPTWNRLAIGDQVHSSYLKITYNYLFTSFSGNRPTQRKCTRTGLRSHARSHPYPITQPVKVGHTTGSTTPTLFE